MTTENDTLPARLFIRHSGSARDAELAEEMLTHLRPLERFTGMDIWTEDRLRAGDYAREAIDAAIDAADVALLLLSADFLGSAALHDVEVPRLLQRHRAGQLRIIPVILRSCTWEVHPWLAELHPLPQDGKPIASLARAKRDEVLAEAAREILRVANSVASARPAVGAATAPRTAVGAASPVRGAPSPDPPVFNIHIANSTIGGFGAGTGVTVTGSVTVPASTASRAAQGSRPASTGTTPTHAGTPMGELASVYLSYGDADLPFAQRLFEALEAAGVSVFFRDEHAVPGARKHRSARNNIREYDHVILLCSERSLPAASVTSELDEMLAREFGEGASERIIPILLDDFVRDGWTPRQPDIRQTILDRVPLDMKGTDRDGGKFEKALKRLLGALRG